MDQKQSRMCLWLGCWWIETVLLGHGIVPGGKIPFINAPRKAEDKLTRRQREGKASHNPGPATKWVLKGNTWQKVRAGELSRMQFTRFLKEVGLAQGGGPMCKRSGAKLLSTNDVDRIFQRANIDSRESPTRDREKKDISWAHTMLDPAKVTEIAEQAIRELAEEGGVEAAPRGGEQG